MSEHEDKREMDARAQKESIIDSMNSLVLKFINLKKEIKILSVKGRIEEYKLGVDSLDEAIKDTKIQINLLLKSIG